MPSVHCLILKLVVNELIVIVLRLLKSSGHPHLKQNKTKQNKRKENA